MHNATLLSRMRAEGIDPALFSPEELSLVRRAAESGDYSFTPTPPCPIPPEPDFVGKLEPISALAQACLDAASPCMPIMQDIQQTAAASAAADLARTFPGIQRGIIDLLREEEARREALLAGIANLGQTERCLICLHTAACVCHNREKSAAISAALGECTKEMDALTAALTALEEEMENLSTLYEVCIPALLDTAAPLFDPAPEETFSAADFRAAALALRNACTKLMNRKEDT